MSRPNNQRRVVLACFGAWTLDSLDFNLFLLVLPVIAKQWGLSFQQIGLLSTATLVASAIGGWLFGALADRYGRVVVLQVTILIFSISSALSGLTQSFEQLVLTRILLGFGFGGEWTVGTVLLNETIKSQQRGRYVGIILSGWGVGWALATLLYWAASAYIPEHLAWRVLMVLGILPSLWIYAIRRGVSETHIFKGQTKEFNNSIFSAEYRKTTLVLVVMAVGIQGGFYALSVWLPTYLRNLLGLSVPQMVGFLAFSISGSILGSMFGGWLADRFGRLRSLRGSSLVAILASASILSGSAEEWLLATALFLGFFNASVTFSCIGAILSEQYPTAIRATGQGFTYNLGRGLGALFPLMSGSMSGSLGLSWSILLFTSMAYFLVLGSTVQLKETRGINLSSEPDLRGV